MQKLLRMQTTQASKYKLNVTLDEIDRQLCYKSFYHFVKIFWPYVVTENYIDNWHIKYICDTLQIVGKRIAARQPHLGDVIINVPPGSSKTTICTIMFPVWVWVLDAKIRTLTASYSAGLSIDHAVKSRDIIKSDKFRALFPDVAIRKDADNKSHYKNTQGGDRLATSVGGTVTGFHAHLLIVDDPLSPKQALSETERQNAVNFFTNTLSTRKVDKAISATILIMQRLHETDPTGWYLEQQKAGVNINHICLPAELSEDVKPPELREFYINELLDVNRMGKTVLNGLKTSLGSFQYSAQMLQRATPIEGGIFKTAHFQTFTENTLPKDENGAPLPVDSLGTDWDLAYTEKTENSASAYVTAGKIGGRVYVFDCGFKHLEFPNLIAWMRAVQAPHYVEGKASGKSAVQTLVNNGIPATEVKITNGDKIARATLCTPFLEAGMILIHNRVYEKLLFAEGQGLINFPKNKHDDLADAFSQAVERLLIQHQVFMF